MVSKISMIAALDENRVIGNKGTLPWYIKKDFKWFVDKTIGKIIVMGRKNYEDIIIHTNGKPLRDRTNVVLTTQKLNTKDFMVAHSIPELLEKFPTQDLMIIGGETLYEQFLPYATELILTEIKGEFPGDTFFPIWDKENFKEVYRRSETDNNINFDFTIYHRKK